MFTRSNALKLLKKHLKRKNLYKHTIAVEAIMSAMAEELGEDEVLWAMTGLLHDIDYDETIDDMSRHGSRSVEILKEEAEGLVSQEVLRAIKAHNPEHTGVNPETNMEYGLMAADAVSGLIVATALVMPSRSLEEVTPKNVMNRFHERDFARSCSRENMTLCEKSGIPLERFFELSLIALQRISKDLGL
jgi:putative nucleotidyltransferase with HDIG domain